jgi:uncharacterized 2Fe-2S/4Fe-4S cluster protein (DUF4445 family)
MTPSQANPGGCLREVSVPQPSLENNTADAERLAEALGKELDGSPVHLGYAVVRSLPPLLRTADHRLRCVVLKESDRWQVCGIRAAADPAPMTGLAVDLGTTRVVLRLLDMQRGESLAETAFDNPQLAVGPDILTRIHYAGQPGGLDRLRDLIVGGINENIGHLLESSGLKREDVFVLAVAGNTAMTHLFLGLPPRWIIREPYIPAVNRPGLLSPRDLGIRMNAMGRIFIFPNIGSYFGGDLIAGILFSGMDTREEAAILVDVGTNAEVVLGNRHWLMACAGAAGPALESGVAGIGMMAAPGVIERVAIHPPNRRFELRTIEEKPPVGICGSGVIDLAAHLFISGMIDIRGRFVPEKCGPRLMEDENGIPHLVLVPADQSATGKALTIGQPDLDSLMRSKAAMYTILETITTSVGMSMDELEKFYVAGTFGSLIDPVSAIRIGMLPDLPLDRYEAIGNSSLGGAALAITAGDAIGRIEAIRQRITYLELNVNQEFMNRFSAAKFLPHTDPERFPSVKVWG